MDKLERLLNLTALLLETSRPLTIGQIHELMEGYPPDPASFRRTFERDKRDLRSEGIPIEIVQLDPADETVLGYRIDPSAYGQRDPGLAPEELAAIRLAVARLRLDGQVGLDTFRKLGGVPDLGDAASTPIAGLDVPDNLRLLVEAARLRKVVEFSYRGELRRLEPHRIDHRGGWWYVSGFDRGRSARRSFRLDRIEQCVSFTADHFDAPGESPGLRFEPWRFGDDPEQIVELAVDADHLHVARSRLGGSGDWRYEPGGRAVVTLAVTDAEALRDVVIDLLGHAEVLSPAALRRQVFDWVGGVVS